MQALRRTGLALACVLLCACSDTGERAVAEAFAPPADAVGFTRCLNLGGALEAGYEGEWGYTIEDAHLAAIAQAGFEAVRLPVNWAGHAGPAPRYRIDPAFLARVDHVIETALGEGLQVVLDVHHFEALMDDPEGESARLRAIWAQLSGHYAGWPDGLVFELLNEPNGAMDAARVNAMNGELLALIREDNPERRVVLATPRWANIEGLFELEPPDDPHIVLSFHYYSPFDFTHQGAPWTDRERTGLSWGSPRERAEITADFRAVDAFAQARGLPVLLGEFGVYGEVPLPARAQWTRAVREAAEARGFAWCHWDFASSFPVYQTGEARWIEDMRAALLD
ncbi:glycoside hydrolase family 5 protein [Marinicauda algicola]|uniref:Glycoside hydrolase family 5 protein n=1 Tax=Marinicauda algicola TaxID=2029849 RepID=A0A4V3RY04_9PROT|nr:glycoside hydrolase family 5 protein [Marinicauda algicola]TGY88499.1 glycoside hydrolase family 5 protein [Marinicauda algicola]